MSLVNILETPFMVRLRGHSPQWQAFGDFLCVSHTQCHYFEAFILILFLCFTLDQPLTAILFVFLTPVTRYITVPHPRYQVYI